MRKLADEVLEMLREPAARAYVSKAVRETMQREWDEHHQRDPKCDQKLSKSLKSRDVQQLSAKETRELLLVTGIGREGYAQIGWPFPVLYKIDSPPGCYLVIAGLNELVVEDPQGFDPRHETIGLLNSAGPALCFMPYKTGWEGVREKHVLTLQELIAAAKQDIESQVTKAKPARRRRKSGRPSDTDHAADQRVWEAWETGSYKTYAKLAHALPGDWTAKTIEAAIDRHRKRIQRSKSPISSSDK